MAHHYAQRLGAGTLNLVSATLTGEDGDPLTYHFFALDHRGEAHLVDGVTFTDRGERYHDLMESPKGNKARRWNRID